MLIAQISDTHILAPTADHPSVELRAKWLSDCIDEINGHSPDAVVFTGDTVQTGQTEEYAFLRELLAPLNAPLYVVPGNRDDNRSLQTALDVAPASINDSGLLQFVIDEHAVRLIGLDSTAVGERKGVFSTERQAWLEETLSVAMHKPTILFIHHPPFNVGDHYTGGYRQQDDADALTAIVARHPQVKALLCGHVHHLVLEQWAGTQAVIMPSVAVDLRKGVDEVQTNGQPMYLLHHYEDGALLSSEAHFVAAD